MHYCHKLGKENLTNVYHVVKIMLIQNISYLSEEVCLSMFSDQEPCLTFCRERMITDSRDYNYTTFTY